MKRLILTFILAAHPGLIDDTRTCKCGAAFNPHEIMRRYADVCNPWMFCEECAHARLHKEYPKLDPKNCPLETCGRVREEAGG